MFVAVSLHLVAVLWSSVCNCGCVSLSRFCVMVLSVCLWLCLFISVLCNGPQFVIVAVSFYLSAVHCSSLCDSGCVSSSRCCVMVLSVWLRLCLFISVLCYGPQCMIVSVSLHLRAVLWSSVCDCGCVSSCRFCVMVLSV